MMKFGFSVFAAFAAATVFGAIPSTPEGWYKPEGGFEKQETTGNLYYDYDRRTGWKSVPVTVAAYGKVTLPKDFDVDSFNDPVFKVAYEALTKAMSNESYLKVIDEALETLGENLHAVFTTDGITVEGTDPNGKKVSYKITFKPGQGIGSDKGTAVENPSLSYKHTDEKSLRWTKGNKAELFGWGTKSVSGTFLSTRVANGVGIPIRRTFGGELEYLNWYGIDNLSLAPHPTSQRLELKGWANEGATMTPLAEAMTQEGDIFSDYELVVRNASKGLNYVSVGKLKAGGGAPVDGASITTNEIEGATEQGVASLRGWTTASSLGIPYKTSNEVLGWFKQEDIIDNLSLGFVDGLIPGAALGKFEVKGASKQTANNRYFGTPAAGAVSLGWYDLPNVTTNAVEGDELTITTVSNEGGIKKLGWKHRPPVGEWPSVARSLADGNIEWLPLPEIPTNFIAAVDNVTITTNDEAALQLKGWDEFGHGVIGKAVNGTLVCKTPLGTNGVEHIENESTLAFGLAGFAEGNNCEENLADLMRLGSTTHKVLARFAATAQVKPTLHYVPLGQLSAPPLDNVTLKTNDVGAASIAGFPAAEDGQSPVKREGVIVWESAEASATRYVSTAGKSVVIGTGSTTNTVTFASAEDSNVRVGVTQNGERGVKITIGVYYQ